MLRNTVPLLVLFLGCFPGPAQAQVKLEWKPQEKFYVELVTNEHGTTKVSGKEGTKTQKLRVVLAVKVVKRNQDKSLLVEQTVESIKASQTKGKIEREDAGLAPLVGTSQQLTFGPKMKITKLEGIDTLLDKIIGMDKRAEKQRKLITTAMTALFRYWAGETFVALPPKPAKEGDKWEQETGFAFEPLGTFLIKKQLAYQGKETLMGRELDKIAVTGKLSYTAPKGDDDDVLPFKLVKLNTKTTDYKGTIYFDAKAGRLSHLDAKMNYEFSMTLSVDGKEIDGEVKSEHSVKIVVHTKKPAEK
jgi:hypothetical protein